MAEGRQMTRSEYTKREAELEYLKSVRRPEVQERIKEARSYGDISENEHVEARGDHVPGLLKGPGHALRVVRPVVFLLINKIVQGRFDHARFREADREEAELPVTSLPDRCVGSQGQRAGEDMSPVVVNVLSNYVDSSRRRVEI